MHDLVQQVLQRQVERVHALLGGVRVLPRRLQSRLLQPVDLLQREDVQAGQRPELTDSSTVLAAERRIKASLVSVSRGYVSNWTRGERGSVSGILNIVYCVQHEILPFDGRRACNK